MDAEASKENWADVARVLGQEANRAFELFVRWNGKVASAEEQKAQVDDEQEFYGRVYE